MTSRFRAQQRELFLPPPPQPKLSQDAYQRILHLLARMMNEHLQKVHAPVQPEVGDE